MHLNRSFSRRVGKKLTAKRQKLLDDSLPVFELNNSSLTNLDPKSKIFLEIGAGMGDHFVSLLKSYPENLCIAAEPYINGIASILNLTETHNLTNFLLWPDDVDLLIPLIPDNLLEEIYILFPDPWPKQKHQKKRLINPTRFQQFSAKLRPNGRLIFASDSSEYFNFTKKLITQDQNFVLADEEFTIPHPNYTLTKYHKIAIKEGIGVQFLRAINDK